MCEGRGFQKIHLQPALGNERTSLELPLRLSIKLPLSSDLVLEKKLYSNQKKKKKAIVVPLPPSSTQRFT